MPLGLVLIYPRESISQRNFALVGEFLTRARCYCGRHSGLSMIVLEILKTAALERKRVRVDATQPILEATKPLTRAFGMMTEWATPLWATGTIDSRIERIGDGSVRFQAQFLVGDKIERGEFTRNIGAGTREDIAIQLDAVISPPMQPDPATTAKCQGATDMNDVHVSILGFLDVIGWEKRQSGDGDVGENQENRQQKGEEEEEEEAAEGEGGEERKHRRDKREIRKQGGGSLAVVRTIDGRQVALAADIIRDCNFPIVFRGGSLRNGVNKEEGKSSDDEQSAGGPSNWKIEKWTPELLAHSNFSSVVSEARFFPRISSPTPPPIDTSTPSAPSRGGQGKERARQKWRTTGDEKQNDEESEARGPNDKRRQLPWESECSHANVTVAAFCEWLSLHQQPKQRGGCTSQSAQSRKRRRDTNPILSQETGENEREETMMMKPSPQRRKLRNDEQYRAFARHSESASTSQTDSSVLTSAGAISAIFPAEKYWGYMDYKHFETLFSDDHRRAAAVDATDFASFRAARSSSSASSSPPSSSSLPVLWIGSEGAGTRLHYDAFGYNLVAQAYGRKRWVLMEPGQFRHALPTRIPSAVEEKEEEEERVCESVAKAALSLLAQTREHAVVRRSVHDAKAVKQNADRTVDELWIRTFGGPIDWFNPNEKTEGDTREDKSLCSDETYDMN
eukprot:jgi/Bigna1/128046/aug1.5_g2754